MSPRQAADRKARTRSTHESLMRFIMGDDWRADEVVAERPVVRHVRRPSSSPFPVVLATLAVVMVVLSVTLVVFPRTAFFLGLVRTPAPLSAAAGNQPGSFMAGWREGALSFSMSERTTISWSGTDYSHRLDYSFRNFGALYAYPTIIVDLLDGDGKVVGSIPFTVPTGVLKPSQSVESSLYWDRDAGSSAAVSYRVTITYEESDTNIYEAKPSDEGTASAEPTGSVTPTVPADPAVQETPGTTVPGSEIEIPPVPSFPTAPR